MTYRIVPCPKCNRLHGVVAVRAGRASRSAAHLVSDSALGARERDGARSSEAPHRVSQDPPVLPRSKASGEVMPGSRLLLDGAPSLGVVRRPFGER